MGLGGVRQRRRIPVLAFTQGSIEMGTGRTWRSGSVRDAI